MACESSCVLLAVAVGAICDEDVTQQRQDLFGLVAEELLVLSGEAEELSHLLTAQVEIVNEYQHCLWVFLLFLTAHTLLQRPR